LAAAAAVVDIRNNRSRVDKKNKRSADVPLRFLMRFSRAAGGDDAARPKKKTARTRRHSSRHVFPGCFWRVFADG